MAKKGFELREYQEACVGAHWSYFEANQEGHPLFVVPTAGGKSIIIAAVLQRAFAAWPQTRVIMLTHVKELIEQNYQKLLSHWQGFCPAGIYSAGMNSRDTRDPIVFAGIQSAYKRAREFGHRDLILIDEAHLIPKSGDGMYLQFLKEMQAINPAVRILGYTATPYRLSGGVLHEGRGRIFTDVAYEIDVADLVRDGWLSPLVPRRIDHEIDLSHVRIQKGEFVEGDVQRAAIENVRENVAEIVAISRAQDRKAWLVFASGVEHAQGIAEELRGLGIDTRTVFGETPKDERAVLVEGFREGRYTALVNVGVLTTGFDAPRLDMIAILRATQSPGLYVQIMGRGMRLFPGKKDCLVLDYGGNVDRHGPINRVIKPGTPDSDAKPRKLTKDCPTCSTICSTFDTQCPACGYVFVIEEREKVDPDDKLTKEASSSPIIASVVVPEDLAVDSVHYRRHEKEGKPTSMRVDYCCGMRTFSEWVCLEHEGFARKKAEAWWRRRSCWNVYLSPNNPSYKPVPSTTAEALERARFGAANKGPELLEPETIGVVPEGEKFWRIVRYFFAPEALGRQDGSKLEVSL